MAIAELDQSAAIVSYTGLGNMSGVIFGPDGGRRSMVPLPGTAGDHAPRIRQFACPAITEAVVILHSDGVTRAGNPAAYLGLLDHSPQVIAVTVLRDAGTRRDDAGAAVAVAVAVAVAALSQQPR
ncbi:hypothetical protein [Actinoplanes sp. GCM10030250]|uniref:hypothetical protein n=1 Tax=Actinoplanes sp. GCM10030250 TaxID=3273376 RepID=UPI00360A3BDA